MNNKIKPGCYVVITDDMTEQQYHAVCKAFIDAGAVAHEYEIYNTLQKAVAADYDCIYFGIIEGELYLERSSRMDDKDTYLTIKDCIGLDVELLPAIGSTCFVKWKHVAEDEKSIHEIYNGKEVVIVAHDDIGFNEPVAVFRLKENFSRVTYYSLVADCFVSAKSDRSKAIEAAINECEIPQIWAASDKFVESVFGRLFDAGLLVYKEPKS